MHFNLHIFNKRFTLNFTAIGLLMLPLFSATVFAHKVMIFAWVDGDTIHTRSKFSGGKKAVNADIMVYNTDDKLLLQGKTDQKGEFSFRIPARTDLRIVLNASMGHKAEWKISSDEIPGAPAPAQKKSEHSGCEPPAAPDNFLYKESDSQHLSTSFTKEEIRKIIEKTLDRKLDPVIKLLADLYSNEPEIKDIIGGLGYIFGLAGVALYFRNRKNKND
jgi:nickel transport protein